MLRFLARFLVFVLAVLLIVAVAGPLLVDPTPAPGATRAETVATADSRFVSIPFAGTNGLNLHYLDSAIDPAVAPSIDSAIGPAAARAADGRELTFVLLHGFTFNAFTWNHTLGTLAPFGRALAYDQIPYGLSAKPLPGTWSGPNPYAKASALEQLFAFLDALGIERAVLVGNSSGGTLALEAALAAPERVQGLILLGPWVQSQRPNLPDWFATLPQMQRISLLLARYLGGNSPLLDYSYADPTRIDDERRALTGIHRRMANWDAAWAALLTHSLSEPVLISQHLEAITQPALVISGSVDQVVPIADTRATAEALPNATLEILPGCGHVPQEECPDQVARVVTDWLRTVSLP
ncbi:alpha/beta hydrolase [Thiohalocapsa marina]|uniref:Alpha/beta hydrolase n=1 Tax=Thiohalocapsa marina TaxID=424902 RepID=A0A5M8FPZ0_9GAMM|nr:alpha/beta hydrolase [Thiohalocapsa marina]KAA6186867.1 alpha/beta hydrolase [Thiohalocapsa marina]